MIEKRNLYRDIVLGLSEGVYFTDIDGRFQLTNPAAEQLLGWTPDDLKDKNLFDIFFVLRQDNADPGEEMNRNPRDLKRSLTTTLQKALCLHKNGSSVLMTVLFSVVADRDRTVGWIAAFRELPEYALAAKEREALVNQLRDSLAAIKSLKGILPICSACKKIRDSSGFWIEIEDYIGCRTKAEFSHSICPDCANKLYPEYFTKKEFEKKMLSLDKRTLARHVFASPIDYVLPGDESYAVHRGIMTDISIEGFGGYFWSDVRVGQKIVIKSKIPVAFHTAVICWVQKDNDNFFRTGLKFAQTGITLPEV